MKNSYEIPELPHGRSASHTQRRHTRHARSLTRAQAQHTHNGSIDRPSSVSCSCLEHKARFLGRKWGSRRRPIDLEEWIKKECLPSIIAWLYLGARLQQSRQTFFRYGDAPLIGN